MAGGYADSFRGRRLNQVGVFTDGVEDADLGYPFIEAPEGVYPFQTNSSGALFHVNRDLKILYPNMDTKSLGVLDSLEELTKKVIRESLRRRRMVRRVSQGEILMYSTSSLTPHSSGPSPAAGVVR